MYSNGYDGVALEFQQQQTQDTARMANALERIALALEKMNLIPGDRTDPREVQGTKYDW